MSAYGPSHPQKRRVGLHGCCERNEVTPLRNPLLQESDITALHKLETSVQTRFDPASNIGKTIRRKATLLAEAVIHRFGVLIAESFYDHEQHVAPRHRTFGRG
jgi:hypothetical protein